MDTDSSWWIAFIGSLLIVFMIGSRFLVPVVLLLLFTSSAFADFDLTWIFDDAGHSSTYNNGILLSVDGGPCSVVYSTTACGGLPYTVVVSVPLSPGPHTLNWNLSFIPCSYGAITCDDLGYGSLLVFVDDGLRSATLYLEGDRVMTWLVPVYLGKYYYGHVQWTNTGSSYAQGLLAYDVPGAPSLFFPQGSVGYAVAPTHVVDFWTTNTAGGHWIFGDGRPNGVVPDASGVMFGPVLSGTTNQVYTGKGISSGSGSGGFTNSDSGIPVSVIGSSNVLGGTPASVFVNVAVSNNLNDLLMLTNITGLGFLTNIASLSALTNLLALTNLVATNLDSAGYSNVASSLSATFSGWTNVQSAASALWNTNGVVQPTSNPSIWLISLVTNLETGQGVIDLNPRNVHFLNSSMRIWDIAPFVSLAEYLLFCGFLVESMLSKGETYLVNLLKIPGMSKNSLVNLAWVGLAVAALGEAAFGVIGVCTDAISSLIGGSWALGFFGTIFEAVPVAWQPFITESWSLLGDWFPVSHCATVYGLYWVASFAISLAGLGGGAFWKVFGE